MAKDTQIISRRWLAKVHSFAMTKRRSTRRKRSSFFYLFTAQSGSFRSVCLFLRFVFSSHSLLVSVLIIISLLVRKLQHIDPSCLLPLLLRIVTVAAARPIAPAATIATAVRATIPARRIVTVAPIARAARRTRAVRKKATQVRLCLVAFEIQPYIHLYNIHE